MKIITMKIVKNWIEILSNKKIDVFPPKKIDFNCMTKTKTIEIICYILLQLIKNLIFLFELTFFYKMIAKFIWKREKSLFWVKNILK